MGIIIQNANETYKNKEWLTQKYEKEQLNTHQIAELAGLKTHKSILDALQKFGMPRRNIGTRKGAKLSEEHKKAISDGGKGRPSGMLGKKQTEEAKEKIRANNIGKHSMLKTEEWKQKISEGLIEAKRNGKKGI